MGVNPTCSKDLSQEEGATRALRSPFAPDARAGLSKTVRQQQLLLPSLEVVMLNRPQGMSPTEWRVTYALKIVGLVVLLSLVFLKILEFIGHVRTVAIIFIGAIFFAYIVYPLVKRLNERLPLWASLVATYLFIALLLGSAISFVIPALAENTKQLVADTPALVRTARAELANPTTPIVGRLPRKTRSTLYNLPGQLGALLQEYGARTAEGFLKIVVSTITILALFIIIPVFAAYLLIDAENLKRLLLGNLPERARPKTLAIIADLDKVIGGFIRGQLMVAAIVGVLITVMLLLLHVKYAILIGVIAGILEIIPYIGAFAGAVPAVLIALFSNGWQNALLVVAGFIIINQLEGHVIAPNIVSGSVGLSPFVVLLALLTGAELLGIAGMLIAVPIAGIIRVIVVNFLDRKASVAQTQPALEGPPADAVAGS